MSCVDCNIWFLNATFPNRWIRRDGPTPWPPRLPDITILTSVYGGMLMTPVPDITNLKARITDTFATITEDMLENTVERNYQLDIRCATKGAHVEVY